MTTCTLAVPKKKSAVPKKSGYLFDPRYKLISVHGKDILSVIWKFTSKFDKKGLLGFSQWLNKNNVDLTSTEPERKITKTSTEIRARSRQLNVLHDVNYVSVAEDILQVLPNRHKIVNDLKEDGYPVIGYSRKSVVASENRVSCLQRMVNILYSRSLVDKVFVSPCSSTKQQFIKRDSSDNDQILSQLNNVHGNTVDFLSLLKNNSKVCVVAIDYAGLTTNVSDLKISLSENPSLKKVIIDQYLYENHFKYFNNYQLLNNPMDLKAFHCRSKPKQRGK
ncbi:hypothetical protein INT47_000039 [Mucor saturninus]|uniref:Uncharacterized protein n=1 Tax=Mucor saturninus TaxID=64648 RepID=A0A8H7RI83_9FUNG|nr:hypothetical protein INT47_000039 [Mucor saturninus]